MREGKRTGVLVVTIYAKGKTSEARRLCDQSGLLSWMKSLASQIERELQVGKWKHCAVYEDELKRFWPLDEEDREAKIAEFAKTYGLRLRFYEKGLCAIFDKCPRGMRRSAPATSTSGRRKHCVRLC